MENRLVWDIEANGLLDTVTKVHCIVGKFIDKNKVVVLDHSNLNKDKILKTFEGVTEFICHNEINYDIPLLKMFYDIDLIELFGKETISDTYLWSKVLFPDRPMPKGCPTSILNPITKKLKRIGPHGLEAWGYRCGEKKIEIYDWRYYNEEMLDRCIIDVNINEMTYYQLLKEMGKS